MRAVIAQVLRCFTADLIAERMCCLACADEGFAVFPASKRKATEANEVIWRWPRVRNIQEPQSEVAWRETTHDAIGIVLVVLKDGNPADPL